MENTNSIADNMLDLQEAFKEAKTFVETSTDMEVVYAYLESKPSRFLSIGYEAAAMAYALKDLATGSVLNYWQRFLENYGAKHSVQVYVGLGWALAQQRADARPFLNDLPALLRYRVLDGYGYYDGFFRRRKALQGLRPEWLDEKSRPVYIQGLGRSLWYSSKGLIHKLGTFVEMVPLADQADLWRGLGIASSYVGGAEKKDWNELWEAAGSFKAQLAAGAAMAVKSRVAANTLQEEEPSLSWCGLDSTKLVALLKEEEPLEDASSKDAYYQWIEKIDKLFVPNKGI